MRSPVARLELYDACEPGACRMTSEERYTDRDVPFDREECLSVAIQAADAASTVLLARFRPSAGAPLDVRYKGPGDPVTDADMAADRAIAEVLESRGAPGNILSEESTSDRGGGQLTWLIDPLCGTVPFSTGLPHWGVSVALASGPELEIGVVTLPTTGEVLSAARGRGALLNGRELHTQEPPGALRDIAVSFEVNSRRFSEAQRALASAVGRQYGFGSGVYPLGQVLLGRLHGAVFNAGLNVHNAGAVVIARELGIRVTDEAGNDAAWDRDGAPSSLLVAWPRTHESLLGVLA